MNNGIIHAFRKLFDRQQTPVRSRTGGARHNVKAFTLVELLCAMAILMIIVLLMSMIFEDTERAWALGTGRAENNMSGRAALNLLAHDLQYGVADYLLTFCMRKDPGLTTYGTYYDADEVFVVSLQDSSADGLRTAREIYYWVEQQPGYTYRYQLMRGVYTNALCDAAYVNNHSYSNVTWYDDNPRPGTPAATHPGTNAVIGVNVAAFGVMAPNGNGVIVHDYVSSDTNVLENNNDRMPEYIDVYVETLTDRDAKRAASIMPGTAACHDFVRKNARRYATRVYFHNRMGYKAR